MNEIVRHEGQAMSVAEIRQNASIIRQVMKDGMERGKDYGTIPGCGAKPTLLKPGSEKILSTFRVAVNPVVADLSTADCARYRVTAQASSMVTGAFLGAGVGEASTDEEKYRWRAAVSDAEFDATPEDRRRVKYYKNGNEAKQVRTNPADLANTVLKMAKKRAQIDMTLTVTAASDIFSQDIEDLDKELRQVVSEEIAEPQRKSEAASATSTAPGPAAPPDGLTVTGVPTGYEVKTGSKNGKDWTKHSIECRGHYYSTFSESDGALLAEAADKTEVTIQYETRGKYRNITAVWYTSAEDGMEDAEDAPPISDEDMPF